MKKIILLLLGSVLFLTSCSKGTPHQQHFMKICKTYMQEAQALKLQIEKIKQDKSKGPLAALESSVVVGQEYKTKIEKPYGAWQTACFANLPKNTKPDCSVLVKYVQKPNCAAATEKTYQAQFS